MSRPGSGVYELARACGLALGHPPHLTVVTGGDGTRYAAWPVAVARLPDAPRVEDGTWRLYANGSTVPYQYGTWTPEAVRRQVLPYLDRGERVGVDSTPWLCEVGSDVLQRVLQRADGEGVAVNERVWAALSPMTGGLPLWQAGPLAAPLLWAQDSTARAEALLMPIKKTEAMNVPDSARRAVSGADREASC